MIGEPVTFTDGDCVSALEEGSGSLGYERSLQILRYPNHEEKHEPLRPNLVLDILRYGPGVEVLRLKSLRDRMLENLLRAVSQYRK